MRILFVNSRDVERIDSGGSRTLIQTLEYIASKDDCSVFTNFKIIGEDTIPYQYVPDLLKSVQRLHDFLVEEDIDIMMVGEARLYTGYARKAAHNCKCKIINELHSMPGYERIGLMTLLKDSLHYNESKIKRLRALLLILVYPLFYSLFVTRYIKIFREAYFKTDKLVLLSENFFKEYQKKYFIRDDKKFAAVGNALSFEMFATEEDIASKKKQLLVVTRLDEQSKRISLVLKAWQRLEGKYPEWSLIIVGNGRSEPQYRSFVKKHQLRHVFFEGRQSPERYYRESPIFLMTSAYEGWGMTLTEAQQMGCVPVAMNSFSALSDIITDGENGFATPNNDMEKFCEKIECLINDPLKRRAMALNAIETSHRFERNVLSEKKYQLYKQVAGLA